jgi:hypothetical protein
VPDVGHDAVDVDDGQRPGVPAAAFAGMLAQFADAFTPNSA